MATATSQVTINVFNAYAEVADYQGLIPWNEVSEACSFFDAELARELYPDLIKELQTSITKQQIPPVRLFDIDVKRFPIGLLKRVTETLEEQGIDVVLSDKTKPQEFGFNFKWKAVDETPHEHQEKMINTAMTVSRYGMLVAPTGSGKTLVQCKLIKKLGVRTLWIVYSKDLVKQTATFVKKYLGVKAGEFGDGKAKLGTITIALSGPSLKKALKTMEMHEWEPGLVLVDEAHKAGAWGNYNLLQKVNAYHRYGLTATPYRRGGDQILLEAAFGETIAEVSIKELQDLDLLAPVTVETIHVPGDEKINVKGATWDEVYRPGIVEHEGRNRRLREKIKEYVDEGRQVLVDVEHKDHIDFLALDTVIDNVAEVTGEDKADERAERYQQFKDGKLSVLVGTVLRLGLDLPSASAVVLAGGYKSKVLVMQEIGRGLRIADGKKDCIVLDSIDQQHYILFQHCQERLKTMMAAGFNVPKEAIRNVKLDIKVDTDAEIERLKNRQEIAKAKRMQEMQKHFRRKGRKKNAV